jgi:folate-binding protein YgfZ
MDMSLTTLFDVIAASSSQIADYAGTPSVRSFSSVEAELSALMHSTGISPLNWRAKLVLTGEDRQRWLNGMITNNTRDLAIGHGNYSFLLNAQGRIQADLTAWNRGEFYLLETDASQNGTIKDFFDRYIIMDDVEVEDISEKLASLGVIGPGARKALERAGFALPELAKGEVADLHWNDTGCTVAHMPEERFESYEIWCAPENAKVLWDAILGAGSAPVGTEALEAHRILHGIPRVGIDIRDRDLPQETAQLHALHHAKGCYIGQEIVERIHSRGAVHRQWTGFEFDAAPAPVGSKIVVGDKEVGEITSTASVPLDGRIRNIALGYSRREHAAPGSEVVAGGQTARVSALPFKV